MAYLWSRALADPLARETIAIRSALAVALAFIGCAAERKAPAVPRLPEQSAVYGRLPGIENVEVSPDGARVAFVKTLADGQRVVAVFSLAEDRLSSSTRVGGEKLRYLRWLDDESLLLATTRTAVPRGVMGSAEEYLMLQVLDVTKPELRPLLGNEDLTMNVAWG